MWRLHKTIDERGFTLFELLVVIALIALVSTVGSVWLPDILDRIVLARAEYQVERELSRVAFYARRTGQDQRVQLDTRGDQVVLKTADSHVNLDRSIKASWIAAAEAGSSEDSASIVYFGTGGASGGRLELSRGKAQTTIVIDWLTGTIRRDEEASQ